MKRLLALGVLVLGVPMLQGALAPFQPAALRPDLSLLVVLGLTLWWRNTASGMVLAAACGFAVDLFSGGLLGLHALLSVVIFTAARVLSLHVNLIGPLPQMLFAAALTAVHAIGVLALTSFFRPGPGWGLSHLGNLGLHCVTNAIVAPFVSAGVSVLVGWIGGEEGGRRLLRFDPRNWAS